MFGDSSGWQISTDIYMQFRDNCSTSHRLLKTASCFTMGTEQQESFKTLKKCLSSAPILSLPDYEKRFQVEMDASVLSQEGKPVQISMKD